MANTITLKGHFGVKQSFNVASTYSTSTGLFAPTNSWVAGQLFVISAASTSLVDEYVAVASTSGSAVLGVALENSTDASTAVAGMAHPSGSKVTILHGHSKFEVKNGAANACYEPEIDENTPLMTLLYASSNGKFAKTAGNGHAIGYLTKAPSASNGYTIGVVLFG